MKCFSKGMFYTFFVLTYLAQTIEVLNVLITKIRVDSGETGFEEGLATNEMAKRDQSYSANIKKALGKRGAELLGDILVHTMHFSASILFFTEAGRLFSMKILNRIFGGFFDLEIVFLTIVVSMLSLNAFTEYVVCSIYKNPSLEIILVWCFFGALFVIPICIFIFIKLLRIFGANFVVSCYLSYFIMEVSDILSISNVDLTKMEKVTPNVFSENIQRLMSDRGLSDSIYREKRPGKNVNAALIGIGNSERIEIYGKIENMDDGQLESILIHEVGHSYDRSLVKKISVFFLLLCLEILFLVVLYDNIAKEFVWGNVSKEGSFIVLICLYFASVRPWLFMLYNLTSQSAEMYADLLTKRYNYNKTLAGTLYKISVDSLDFLAPSWLYNSLNSLHPSIMSRIEYLSN
ncbi:peptidase M48 domain-containing protein [Encephalitozoon hellem ATCC 50504]|uniref:Caax prenyl protease-like protein n=1 Tax=Encephalitozoon hellem TaxID=27973 RepID=A0A9Q9C344_ENCHE|nr:peptidase M48 domain-containing protein [Encephalitozoon hellem ATCC 50504]AFM98360.1 peptidase M48 domain-containing protein [Encephalitozoon hellem ATCC 50504]UTX43241.1 caax prenyl protease-like protein [Encephalitozoon hellem]WEL38699.1 caax prenyl protease-like protein [Encephalitozoon hellem]|eukprot:XP_003887341.1 peptidase M48 domain-containing protein [Encephalitozoon hellem ATCC 50504]